MYQRLEAAGQLTGLPINSIVVVACLEWLDAHQPEPTQAIFEGPIESLRLSRGFSKSMLQVGARKGPHAFDQFSVRAKDALRMAQEEAEKRRQPFIDPAHLLLGLSRLQSGFAAAVLPRFGIDVALIEAHLGLPAEKPLGQRVIPTAYTKRVIESAFALARDWQHRWVGTGHLLMGLVTEGHGVVADVFKAKAVTIEILTAEINRLRGTVGPED